MGEVAQSFNPSTWEAGTDLWIQGQCGLQSEFRTTRKIPFSKNKNKTEQQKDCVLKTPYTLVIRPDTYDL